MESSHQLESNMLNDVVNRVWMSHKEIEDGVRCIRLSGRLDVRSVPSIEAGFAEAIGGKSTIVDLSGVELMNSVGLGMLISEANLLHEEGRVIVLLNPSPRVERVVRIAGVDKFLLPIVFDIASALKIIKNAAG